jgi:hypothetical protein
MASQFGIGVNLMIRGLDAYLQAAVAAAAGGAGEGASSVSPAGIPRTL